LQEMEDPLMYIGHLEMLGKSSHYLLPPTYKRIWSTDEKHNAKAICHERWCTQFHIFIIV
jgi:hypothetical protein